MVRETVQVELLSEVVLIVVINGEEEREEDGH
jgi:hypothetical protein